ncbi:MAG TPA: HNH endonuclease [Thermoanaerobaculia bacterium]|nr:HNH endonuclease [Thermoanaerobaculia bacterium]
MFHIVQGGIENGDLDWLKQAKARSVSPTWVVPKTAHRGDSVAIYVPTHGIIAVATLVGEPKPRTDWPSRYGARLSGFRLLKPPMTLDHIRKEAPDFDWVRYPRSITTPQPTVAARLSRAIEKRLRSPHLASGALPDIARDIEFAEPELAQVEATTRTALVQARMGQGVFRDKVSGHWKAACALSGCTVIGALRASHIKPWRDSTNEERLDPFNGLLLVGTIDALFDAGLVSFSDTGHILLGFNLTASERKILGLRSRLRLRALHRRHLPYLRWHREQVFVGAA